MASMRKAEPQQLSPKVTWLVPVGEMGRLIAEHNWNDTEFGPLADWPPHLRMAVNLMLSGGSAMTLVWGKEFRLLYNDCYRDVIRDKHPQALGESSKVIFAEAWGAVRPLYEQAYRGDAVMVEDFTLPLTRGGVTKEASFSGSYNPIRNEAGAVDGFLAVVVEVTERLKMERERAQVFDTTLSSIADFAYSFDRAGRFLYANKALLDLWGLQLADVVGKNFIELNYSPEEASRLQRQIDEVFERKIVVRDEARYVGPAGEGFYEYILTPVFNADSAVEVVAGSSRDVTARVKLERDLRDMKARMETTLKAGAIGTWSWDVAADRTVADHILARFFSVSDEDANGGPISSYMRAIHPDDRGAIAQKISDVLAHGSSYEAEYRLVGADHGVRWVVARASIVRDAEGRAVTMPGMVIDITERKRLEHRLQETIRDLRASQLQLERQAGELEAQVKERTARLQETVADLEAFSYSISHDLRGPLRVMQSFAEALREDCGETVGADGQDYIRRIVAASVRMDRVIQDVLGYSRITRTEIMLEEVALDEFVQGLLDGYPAFHDHKADITVDAGLPVVIAHPAVLNQCLANLIGNALKFVAPGERPVIRISAKQAAGRAFVSVTDKGIGIPKRAHESIFNVFYRHESGYEGTGIGLSIVRKGIERLGGRITVDSEPGSGSTFTFDLPLATTR